MAMFARASNMVDFYGNVEFLTFNPKLFTVVC